MFMYNTLRIFGIIVCQNNSGLPSPTPIFLWGGWGFIHCYIPAKVDATTISMLTQIHYIRFQMTV